MKDVALVRLEPIALRHDEATSGRVRNVKSEARVHPPAWMSRRKIQRLFRVPMGNGCTKLTSFQTAQVLGGVYNLRLRMSRSACGSVGSVVVSQPQGCEFESRSSHFSFLLLAREIYAHAIR